MQADYALELGSDDPALEMPWRSPDGACSFVDLKRYPEQLPSIREAEGHAELAGFLRRINAPDLPLQSAKCDVWSSAELSPEEEIFGASCKYVSYIDLLFTGNGMQMSLEKHEAFAREVCQLLERAPEMASGAEFVIRHCHYHRDRQREESVMGFCISAYVSGYGDNPEEARKRWGIALKLLQNVLVQYGQRL
jgi:hypothetical protein